MRWKAKLYPKLGDRRTRWIFPILPKKIGAYVYWLERIHIDEEYYRRQSAIPPKSWWRAFAVYYKFKQHRGGF